MAKKMMKRKSAAKRKTHGKVKVKRTITTTRTDRSVRTLGELSTRQFEVHAANARAAAKKAEASAEGRHCGVAVTQLVGAALQTGVAAAHGGNGGGLTYRTLHVDLHRAELAVRKNCT